MAGKGDDRRPSAISEQELTDRWAATFGTTERKPTYRRPRPRPEDILRRQKELFTQAGPSEVAPK